MPAALRSLPSGGPRPPGSHPGRASGPGRPVALGDGRAEGSTPGAGGDVIGRLRGRASGRRSVDPGLAGGLRAWLEDGVATGAGRRPAEQPPLVVDAAAVAATAVGGGRTAVDRRTSPSAQAHDALVRALFRQVVTTGRIHDPMDDGLSALEADRRDHGAAALLRDLPAPEYTALAEQVEAEAAQLLGDWPALAPGWWPRTRDPLAVPLAGGRVELRAVADLTVGLPSSGRASVCVVELRPGRPQVEDRDRRHFAALLETLRSGAPPFRVATYSSVDGSLDVDEVTDGLLARAVGRTIDAVARMDADAPGPR